MHSVPFLKASTRCDVSDWPGKSGASEQDSEYDPQEFGTETGWLIETLAAFLEIETGWKGDDSCLDFLCFFFTYQRTLTKICSKIRTFLSTFPNKALGRKTPHCDLSISYDLKVHQGAVVTGPGVVFRPQAPETFQVGICHRPLFATVPTSIKRCHFRRGHIPCTLVRFWEKSEQSHCRWKK